MEMANGKLKNLIDVPITAMLPPIRSNEFQEMSTTGLMYERSKMKGDSKSETTVARPA